MTGWMRWGMGWIGLDGMESEGRWRREEGIGIGIEIEKEIEIERGGLCIEVGKGRLNMIMFVWNESS